MAVPRIDIVGREIAPAELGRGRIAHPEAGFWIRRVVVERPTWYKPGQHVSIAFRADAHPVIAGLFGPDPPYIHGNFGHIRTPKSGVPGRLGPVEGRNCKAGVYYFALLEWDGRECRPLRAPVQYSLELGGWRLW